MSRVFADMHLCPNLKDMEQVERMIKKASELGYRLIAITLPQDFGKDKTQKLRSMCREVNLDFVSRLDLKPKTPRDLVINLRKLRRKFEIISVMCESKNVARQAAKDNRVDILNFPSTDPRKRFFDKAEAELASKSLVSLEIDIRLLLLLEGLARIRLLSLLRKEVAIAKGFHIPIILSSGAKEELLMRKPRETAALASLFDMDKALAIEAVSKNPLVVVKRNREKLGPNFVAPGIRVIREGNDC
ncbi:MAG: RNase P subunit p30 family protein [Candidatus Bathyarchaeia archaeon]